MAAYPGLDVRTGPTDAFVSLLHDLAATAIEERGGWTRVFFQNAADRDRALATLRAQPYVAEPVEVDDGDWARRSQTGLRPVQVGRLIIAPAWSPELGTPDVAPGAHPAPDIQGQAPGGATILIAPSTGFGTGHHATTRLCLRALQALDLGGRSMLDVGTGSGVLAISAALLGAAPVLGIDNDPDAVAAARHNLHLNPAADTVEFRVADLRTARLQAADLITANLTGAELIRSARLLAGLLRPAGTLIVSGLLDEERDEVADEFVDMEMAWEQHEDGWVALAMKRS